MPADQTATIIRARLLDPPAEFAERTVADVERRTRQGARAFTPHLP
ncbi:hypothetical protein [Saccharothrix saharensis]|nr:hypothetical protein [Saccharothrix saharensis]